MPTSPAPTATTAAPAPQATATTPAGPVATPTAVALPTSTPPAPELGLEPKYGGIINMTGIANPSGWDPHAQVLIEDAHAMSNMYNQLIEWDPHSPKEIIGDIARSWELGADGQSYTFRIHEGIQWTDGTPLTIDDVLFSIKRVVDPDAARPTIGVIRNYLRPEGVEKVDNETVTVRLDFPTGAFIKFFAMDNVKMLPQHHLETDVDIGIYENILGSGPFMPVQFQHGTSYESERNPNYFKTETLGYPYFDGIKSFLITDKGTEIAAYKTGRVMMGMSTINHLDAEDLIALENDEDFSAKYDIWWQIGTSGLHLLLNATKPPFDNADVRRAMFLAMDRQEITDGFGLGRFEIGAPMSVINPFHLPKEELLQFPGYRQQDGQKHPGDIAEAVRLLNSLGYTEDNPLKFSMIAPLVIELPDVSQVMQDQYQRSLPVEIDLIPLEIAASINAAVERSYDSMALGVASMINDPDDRFNQAYLPVDRNFTSWHDPEVDAIFAQQQREPDIETRRELAYEMQRKILNGSPAIIEFFWKSYGSLVNKRIKTREGHYVQPASTFLATKHEHEWLEPE
jgi:ABC-type transport system substrate-binding protein